MAKEDILIVGSLGQVGRALFMAMKKQYNIFEHDIVQKKTFDGMVDVTADAKDCTGVPMHVCIPFSEDFQNIVKAYNSAYKPSIIIIHSSLKPGTTRGLFDQGLPVVHSPAFFDERDFRTFQSFRKVIGYDSQDLAIQAQKHLSKCFNCILIEGSKNSELSDVCLGLYTMTCFGVIQDMARIFKLMGCNYAALMDCIDVNNYGFASLQKERFLLPNVEPRSWSEDYRIQNIDLIPENLRSAYFRVTLNSNKKIEEELSANRNAQEVRKP